MGDVKLFNGTGALLVVDNPTAGTQGQVDDQDLCLAAQSPFRSTTEVAAQLEAEPLRSREANHVRRMEGTQAAPGRLAALRRNNAMQPIQWELGDAAKELDRPTHLAIEHEDAYAPAKTPLADLEGQVASR